ncbi:MAG: phenylalanine--tRNA ligase beta subunit-related protein [Deltaproteobacteria bacterium]|nr:phenylalanine--tRNA ligase beta subunit-related protein [Deltaproteobacteria bacterium]
MLNNGASPYARTVTLSLTVATHPSLCLQLIATQWPAALGGLSSPALGAEPPDAASLPRADDTLRGHVRDLLRHGGFKPTGRSKPSSEYLLRVAKEQPLAAINVAVDLANYASLHSGLPISVVDLDRTALPLAVRLAAPSEQYVFNASGQVLDVANLLCLHDALGPCANAVKDAQRTKTHADTRTTLTLIWAPVACREHSERTRAWLDARFAEAQGRSLAVAIER